jgi:tetratricopeptide (TPR) repeat protein
MASAVLCSQVSARLLWQLAELGTQDGLEALEEAIKSGILCEEQAGTGRPGRYRFAHDLIRDVVYTELGAARRQVLHQRALERLSSEGARAAVLAYHAQASGEAEAAYPYCVRAGVEAVAVFAVDDAIGHYEQARALLQDHQRLQTELPVSEVERLYAHLGQAYAFQNAWEKAQQAFEELLAYAQQQRQFTLASMTLNRLAILAIPLSKDRSQVQALLEDAWHMAETSSDQQAQAETEWNRSQIIGVVWEDPKRALSHGEHALELARASHDQELEARSLTSLGYIHVRAGDFEEAMHALEAALALYAHLGNESSVSGELSLPFFGTGGPLTQPLTNRATEAWCWALLALAQVHAGQVQGSMRSSRKALALAQESKNVWAHVISTICLTLGLLDAGAYEEALGLMQDGMALARTLPPTLLFYRSLTTLGRTYHAVQQWEEARSTLEEAVAVAERLGLGLYHVPTLSQLCMHYAEVGEWEAAHRYAMQASAIRKGTDAGLILQDYSSPQYETEAFLRGGNERQAREEVHRLGERLGSNRRFRIPYLQSLVVLAAWEGRSEQAISHLREAAGLAADMGLPAEQWQIQAALATVYEAGGEPAQAQTAFAEAARIIGGLAESITDEARRARFLAGPQTHPVLQHVQGEASPVAQDQAEQSGR